MPFAPREPATATEAPRPRAAPQVPLAAEHILALQRSAGNAAVARLMRTPAEGEEKRYDFAVTLYGAPVQHRGLTPAQVIEKFRMLWRILHQQLDRGRGRHLELLKHRRENRTAGFWSDVLGGAELPSEDIWNELGADALHQLHRLLESTDAALKGQWAAGEAVIDRGLPAALRSNPYLQAELAFDATRERIKQAVRLVEQAVRDLDECERQVDQYREDHARGASRAITGINVSIVVLSAATAGAGAGAAGSSLGAQAAAGAGIAGGLGVAHETFTQVGEIRIGERESFDVARIAKRGARDVVAGFVGGVVAGRFSKVLSARVGGWVGRIPQATLDKYGIARAELLTNAEQLFLGWVAATASSPLATTAGVLMDSAMAGKLSVRTWGDFSGMVFDDLVASAALGGFLTYANHKLPPRPGGRPAPAPAPPAPTPPASKPRPAAPKSTPVRGTGTPRSGAKPRTDEQLSPRPIKRARPYNHKDPGKEPAAPKRETRATHDPNRKFASTEQELRDNLKAAFARAGQTVAQRRRAEKLQGDPPKIKKIIQEIAAKDPKFAADLKLYHQRLSDPKFITSKLVELWHAARRNGHTMAEELELQLGSKTRGRESFNNDNTPVDQRTQEFKEMLERDRVFIDESFAQDFHGSHTHAFQEWLGNQIWPPDGGRTFRRRLLQVATPDAYQGKDPYWTQVWNQLFDAYNEQGLHAAEVLGRLLQEAADFPRGPMPTPAATP
jgi:hypothetical protein